MRWNRGSSIGNGEGDGRPDGSTGSHRHVILLALCLLTATFVAGCTSFDKPGEDAQPSPGDADGDDGQAPGGSRQGEDANATGPTRDQKPWSGAWLGTWPSDENNAIASFEQTTGHRPDVVDLLVSWNTSYKTTRGTLTNIASAGGRPLITWSPVNLTTEQIADGSTQIELANNETVTLDAYIDAWADGLCSFAEHTGRPALLEPMPEPNGDWHAWSVGYTTPSGESPNTNESYKRAWSHVVERMTQRCPDGITFIWTINGANAGPGSSFLGAMPSEEKIDLAGIRGLNLGTYQDRGWASFGATVGHAYCNVTQASDLDVVLTGIGSVEDGGDKPVWIREAFRNASSHAWDRIAGIVWYHDTLTLASGEEVDVGVASSQASQEAYREAVQGLRSGPIPDGTAPPC